MNVLKIAHTADLHIGTNCKNLGETAEIRKNEVKNSIYKILEICAEENINILLIAGDLFDNSNVTKNISDEVKIAFSQANFKIIISPGNHDPFTVNSVYDSSWPENVYIFKYSKMDYFEFSELKIRVFGTAFEGMYQNESMLKNINISDNFINIGVMHADFSSKEYNPITSENITNSGLDYIALGHIHKRTEIQKAGSTHFAYSGCPEGIGFDECDEKGIYIGKISKNFCDLKFKQTCKRQNEVIEFNVSILSNDFEIAEGILKTLKNKFGENYSKNLFKIILIGETVENCIINAKNIESILKEKLFFVKVTDKTKIAINIRKLMLKNDFKGIFIKNMVNKIKTSQNNDEIEIQELALKLGLKAFSEEVVFGDF